MNSALEREAGFRDACFIVHHSFYQLIFQRHRSPFIDVGHVSQIRSSIKLVELTLGENLDKFRKLISFREFCVNHLLIFCHMIWTLAIRTFLLKLRWLYFSSKEMRKINTRFIIIGVPVIYIWVADWGSNRYLLEALWDYWLTKKITVSSQPKLEIHFWVSFRDIGIASIWNMYEW